MLCLRFVDRDSGRSDSLCTQRWVLDPVFFDGHMIRAEPCLRWDGLEALGD